MNRKKPIAAIALATLLALLLAPGEARARDDCGALNAGNSFTQTCPDAAYTGIVYWDLANAVTLTVTGGAATTITAGANNGVHNGVTIRTDDHATNAHNISLTVGSGGAVAIEQSGTRASSWYNNRGIVVFQRAGNGSTTTLDVRSGTTIGTATAKMESHGIQVTTYESDAGDISVTTAAAIHSEDDGIYVSNPGAGDITVRNRGAVTSDAAGIHAKTTGKDADGDDAGVSITHSAGDITTPNATGVKAHVGEARQETDAGHDDYVAPMNAGLAKVSVTGGSISSRLFAISALNYEAGSVEVDVAEGVTLTSTEGDALRANLTDVGNESGTITVTQAGKIVAAGWGIVANRLGGSGAVSVTNRGDIEAGGDGIYVTAKGAGGAVSVTNSGAIGRADAAVARGIFAALDGAGDSGGVTVANSGDITATDHGILAQTTGKDADGANTGVSITHSAGAIVVASDEPVDDGSQGVKEAIVARVGSHRAETETDRAAYVAPKNIGLAKVAVTGGSVHAKGVAIEAANYEAGGVEISVSEDVELTSTHDHGIEATLRDAGNKTGTISITQAGTISAAKDGVSAGVAWSGGAGPARAIDIVWTGTFTSPEAPTRAPLAHIGRALERAHGQQTARATRTGDEGDPPLLRYAQATAGIDAGVMHWATFMRVVAEGDDPGAFADAAAVTALFADSADAATKARAAAIIAQFRSVLTNESLGTIPGAGDIDADDDGTYSDAEITAYLSEDSDSRRELLRSVLTKSFTEHELTVFRALMTGGDVDAALTALPDATNAWKRDVRALVNSYNASDIRVAVNGGSIDSRGDGITAWYATPHANNGGISVTVAKGASVTGAMAGVYVANAGRGLRIEKKYAPQAVQDANANLGADAMVLVADHLNQVVRVRGGVVTGGSDAAVHLDGGGALIVTDGGRLVGGSSGRAILVNDPGPAIIYIGGEVKGGEGPADSPAPAAVHLTGGGSVTIGLTGSVDANGAARAIQGDAPTTIIIHMDGTDAASVNAAAARVKGAIGGAGVGESVTFAEANASGTTGFVTQGALDSEGALISVGFRCGMATDRRCELYEALPSLLLALNRLPAYAERMAAPRGSNGVWGRVEAAQGEWTADKAVSAKPLAYDYDVAGGRAGFDFEGAGARFGLSAHFLKGKAEMDAVGEMAVSGMGAGASATWLWGGFHLDFSGQATWFDAEFDSSVSGKLEKDASGKGFALGVEIGRRASFMEGALAVTPRLGLVWSNADLSDFTDSVGSAARVSVEKAWSARARAGFTLETGAGEGGRLFASADLEQEFSDETSVEVGDAKLDAESASTTLRLGVGGALPLGESAALTLSGSYAASGSDTSQYGGAASLSVRF